MAFAFTDGTSRWQKDVSALMAGVKVMARRRGTKKWKIVSVASQAKIRTSVAAFNHALMGLTTNSKEARQTCSLLYPAFSLREEMVMPWMFMLINFKRYL